MKEIIPVEKFLTIQDTLFTVGGKWRFPIIYALCNGPKRFSEISKDVAGISPKVLNEELKQLEIHQLVVREVSEDAKTIISYSLTEHAESLRPLFELMFKWGSIHKKHLTGREKAA